MCMHMYLHLSLPPCLSLSLAIYICVHICTYSYLHVYIYTDAWRDADILFGACPLVCDVEQQFAGAQCGDLESVCGKPETT